MPTARSFHGLRFVLVAACLVVIISGLKAAKVILIPFMFAVFLALLASGPIYWLKKKGVPNWLAILGVTVLIISLSISIIYLLLNSLNQFSEQLPQYKNNLTILSMQLGQKVSSYGLDLSQLPSMLDPSDLLNVFTTTFKGAIQAISSFVLVIIMMVFMTLETASIREKVRFALGTKVDLEKFDGVAIDVEKYLIIKTLMSFVTGILVGLWVWAMGVDFPLLWGLVAFILNYVPFIGSIIAAVPAVILALVQIDPATALILAIGYIIINISISNFLEPVFMGKRLGISVLIVFLSLLFWGWVWGPAGALMSVPLTMIVKILFEHSPQFSWVSIMMGSTYEKKA